MSTQKKKKSGELINISVGPLLTEMVVAVIPDILKILTGFRCEFNVFHRQALCLLLTFSGTRPFPTPQARRCSGLLPVNSAGSGDVILPVSREGDEVTRGSPHSAYDNHLIQ
jgi:hypothetical protein